jgi:flagellar basal-body rod protein FlgB
MGRKAIGSCTEVRGSLAIVGGFFLCAKIGRHQGHRIDHKDDMTLVFLYGNFRKNRQKPLKLRLRRLPMIGNSLTSAIVNKALDGVWQRQKAISGNIANYETPGYKAKKVSFEAAMKSEMEKNISHSAYDPLRARREIEQMKIHTTVDVKGAERADGNNVNLDVENIDLAKAQIQYQYLVRSMTDTLSRLRYAISEGRK